MVYSIENNLIKMKCNKNFKAIHFAKRMEKPTNIIPLDRLLDPIDEGKSFEIYGTWRAVLSIAHKTIASLSKYGRVGVIYIQDFGYLDPYLIHKHADMIGGNFDDIYISRAFRRDEIADLINSVKHIGIKSLVIIDPYLFSPQSYLNYSILTPITGSLKELLSYGITVSIFNRETSLGRYLPEGGKFHHHELHAIIKINPYRNGFQAVLIKHYAKRTPIASFISIKELGDERLWVGQHLLQEWF
ncbi:MAG: hypothetical protein ACP5I6_05510 [Caldisphaera sp.]|jgi:hypothetical protein|nr:hypothetical protein [Caldisphaera sp.]PMP60270.1 MAG: hypothetical protein C0201_03150 [Caldisphaera sp.]PMP88675.1 MAG: hypothetical protein C0172_02065 [Caldisphaera sp.]